MAPPFPGWVNTFANDILLDSGALYMGAVGAGTLLGRSTGGLSFDPGHTVEHIEFDGKRADIVGLHHITDFKALIKGKLLQFGNTILPVLEPGLTSASGSGSVTMIYIPRTASQLFDVGSYVQNIRLIFRRQDLSYIQFRFAWGICQKYTVTTRDKRAAEIDVEFAAALNMSANNPFTNQQATTDDAPYGIELLAAGSTL